MGLFGHMRIHESGIDRSPHSPTTSNTSAAPSPTLHPSSDAHLTTNTTTGSAADDTDTADFSCPHCPRTFTSRIGLERRDESQEVVLKKETRPLLHYCSEAEVTSMRTTHVLVPSATRTGPRDFQETDSDQQTSADANGGGSHANSLTDIQRHQIKHRELFLSRQVECLPATHIRGKCSVTLYNEVEPLTSNVQREDAFYYRLIYDPSTKRLQEDRGSMRIGSDYQSEIQPLLKKGRMFCLPQGINGRLMNVRLPFRGTEVTTIIINAYASSKTGPDEVKNKLYEDLHALLVIVLKVGKLIVIGSHKACDGTEHAAREEVLGSHGIEGGGSACMHPRSRSWQLLEVRSQPYACDIYGWTDNRLVIPKIGLLIQPRRRPPHKSNTVLWDVFDHRLDVTYKMTHRLEEMQTTEDNVIVKMQWSQPRNVVQSKALDVLVCARLQNQNWFDDDDDEKESATLSPI
ncbi:Metastasis-associated protein mta1 [Sparganum proliferum]